MDEILELATKLGKLIAADPRAVSMMAVRRKLDESLIDRQLLTDYQAQQQKVHELEITGKPIEPDDKRKLQDLHEKVAASAVIKELLKVQMDYVDLMTRVSQAIEAEATKDKTGA